MSDVDLIKQFRQSPIFFIEKIWNLTPQPLKEEFKEEAQAIIKDGDLNNIQANWFQPFVKGKNITWQQWVLFLAVERGIRGEAPKRISVVSGHGIGKGCSLSFLIHWFLFCHKDAVVPCTAPTSDQMYDALWKEVSFWHGKLPEDIKNLFEWSAQHYRVRERGTTWFARARTASKDRPEALAGIHAPHVLAVCDEASAIHEEVFRVGEGALTAENTFVIMTSNGTRSIGYFHATHHGDKDSWQTLSFDSGESPVVDRSYVDRIIALYGKDSDEYRIRVSGKFPRRDAIDDRGFVPLFSEDELRFTDDEGGLRNPKLGVDPSGDGKNFTAWVARDTFRAKVLGKEQVSNAKSIGQKTMTIMSRYPSMMDDDVSVDSFGVGADTLQELGIHGIRVNSVNGGKPADNPDLFLNKRAEMFWRMREWVIKGGEIVRNDDLKKEMLNIRYKRNLNGKIQIMSKEEMRKEGIKSPDIADALAYTFFHTDGYRRSRPLSTEQVANITDIY